jgi:hypothetical protein
MRARRSGRSTQKPRAPVVFSRPPFLPDGTEPTALPPGVSPASSSGQADTQATPGSVFHPDTSPDTGCGQIPPLLVTFFPCPTVPP